MRFDELCWFWLEFVFARRSADELEQHREGKSAGGESVLFAGPDESGWRVLLGLGRGKKRGLLQRPAHLLSVLVRR